MDDIYSKIDFSVCFYFEVEGIGDTKVTFKGLDKDGITELIQDESILKSAILKNIEETADLFGVSSEMVHLITPEQYEERNKDADVDVIGDWEEIEDEDCIPLF